MKIYLKKNRFPKLPVILLISFIVLIIGFNFFQKEIKNIFYTVSLSIQKVFWRAGERTSNFFVSFIKTGGLKKENIDLKNKNQELILEIEKLNELKKENKTLKTALNIGLEKEFQLIMVEIIGHDTNQEYLLLDKGSRQGVVKNMPLISAEKVLFGRVSEVYDNYSKGLLISSSASSFGGKIESKDISAVVKGKGGNKILFDIIPRDKEIAEGDIVLSSKTGGIFPDHLLVGKVEKIKKNDLDAFQQAELEPFFNIQEVRILFLITEKQSNP